MKVSRVNGSVRISLSFLFFLRKLITGWLTKLGGSGLTPKNWRRRWFVVKDGMVYYYKTPSDDVVSFVVSELKTYA